MDRRELELRRKRISKMYYVAFGVAAVVHAVVFFLWNPTLQTFFEAVEPDATFLKPKPIQVIETVLEAVEPAAIIPPAPQPLKTPVLAPEVILTIEEMNITEVPKFYNPFVEVDPERFQLEPPPFTPITSPAVIPIQMKVLPVLKNESDIERRLEAIYRNRVNRTLRDGRELVLDMAYRVDIEGRAQEAIIEQMALFDPRTREIEPVALDDERFDWAHEAVLEKIVDWMEFLPGRDKDKIVESWYRKIVRFRPASR